MPKADGRFQNQDSKEEELSSKKRFENLEVYQTACKFDNLLCSIFTYERSQKDPGLRAQVLNSSGSCQDNIAEGYERGGNAELMNFLRIAKGSIGESRSQVLRAKEREWISQDECDSLIPLAESISKQLGGYLSYLKKSGMKGERYLKEPGPRYGSDIDLLNLES